MPHHLFQPGPHDVWEDNRAVGRMQVDGLSCDRGRVIDLSVRGMRMHSRRGWGVGQLREITLISGVTRLRLPARCVWARRDGFFAWTIGLAFEGASAEDLRVAAELSLLHEARLDAERKAA